MDETPAKLGWQDWCRKPEMYPDLWRGAAEGHMLGTNVTVLFYGNDTPGEGPKWHVHPYDEVFVIREGRALFAEFCEHMARCYDETLTEMVLFEAGAGTRGAAEYMVNGTYLETDAGLPEARGQSYRLPAGSFFTLRDGKIARVTTYYNLADWMAQVR